MDITLLVLCDDTLGNVMFVTHKGVFRYVSSVNDRSGMRGARILEWYGITEKYGVLVFLTG